MKKVAEQIVSLDFLRSSLKYPSLKHIFTKIQELLPPEDFPYSHHILTRLIATFGGCDTISLSFNPGVPASTDSLTNFGAEVSYSYSVNPVYTEIGDNQNYSKKTVLFLESFKDFITPQKWLEAGKEFGTNVGNTAESVVNEGKKIIDSIFLTEGANL